MHKESHRWAIESSLSWTIEAPPSWSIEALLIELSELRPVGLCSLLHAKRRSLQVERSHPQVIHNEIQPFTSAMQQCAREMQPSA
uniref:Uncharacterized protein n=1 Tax=Romanomermis culicivorax TaxID=13658 RepID=A0A915JPM5_ROMCU